MSELPDAKACPFCGEKSIAIHEGSTFRWVVAECNGCGARCGEVRVQTMGAGLPAHWKAKAEQDAVEEWNKRAIGSCTWREDEDGNWWTDCDNGFVLTDGGPKENGMCVCCYCGGELREQEYSYDDDQ